MQDSLMVAIFIISKKIPDVKQNVFQMLQNMKNVKLINFKYDRNQWLSKMETSCTSIKKNVPNSYHKDQYIMDFFNGTLQVPSKTFKCKYHQ